MPDPFAAIPDATAADFDVSRSVKRPETPCGLTSPRKKRKQQDFNPLERARFERLGYTYARTEWKSAWDGRKHDLWTFGDWLAVQGDITLIVQTCAYSSMGARETKARKTPELALWLAAPHRRFEIHGWRQPAGPGTRWECVVREVKGDLTACETTAAAKTCESGDYCARHRPG